MVSKIESIMLYYFFRVLVLFPGGENNGMVFSSIFKFSTIQPQFHTQTDDPRLNFKRRFFMRLKILELDEIQKSASSVSIFQMKKSRPQKSRLSSPKSHNSKAGTPHRKKCL